MPHKEEDLEKRDILMGHLVVSIIRVQEEADRTLMECKKFEDTSGREGGICRRKAKNLERKAACYLEKYESLRKSGARSKAWAQEDCERRQEQ
jgi:hypothetical protein